MFEFMYSWGKNSGEEMHSGPENLLKVQAKIF